MVLQFQNLPFAELISFLKGNVALAVVLAAFGGLLLWRIVKFSVIPILYPNDPTELPYWIPILGHGVAFFKNSNRLMDNGQAYFGKAREPFAITAIYSRMYVLTDPKDIAAAYRNTTTFSFEVFVKMIMRNSGSSEFAIEKMYQPPKTGIFPNPHKKPLAGLSRELHSHQLHPGPELDSLRATVVKYFNESLSTKSISQLSYSSSLEKEKLVVPLYVWASDVMISSAQKAYFGSYLAELQPTLWVDFMEFDDLAWQSLYQLPTFLTGKLVKARTNIIKGLEDYFTASVEKRGPSSWFTPATETELRMIGLGTHDIAVIMMTVYWGINTNTRRACFWMLAYMLFEPELIQIVREETKGAFADDESIPDIKFLENNCPRMNGIWDESMRLSAYSSSVRYITQDTTIGGKILRRGGRLVIPNRQLHFDERMFGEKVNEFNSNRFMENDRLLRSGSWRPFGGGSTICPGRFIAKQAVLSFIAMLLKRFDVEMTEPQNFPRFDEGVPGLGIMSPKGGDDLNVTLTGREI